LVRAPDGAGPRQPPAVLRAGRLPGQRGDAAGRSRAVRGGDRARPGEGHPRAHRRRGNGPVNALDHALRKALEEFYPNLREMTLLDYKVRILDESKGTAAKTRVLITSGDGEETWGTVGVA